MFTVIIDVQYRQFFSVGFGLYQQLSIIEFNVIYVYSVELLLLRLP